MNLASTAPYVSISNLCQRHDELTTTSLFESVRNVTTNVHNYVNENAHAHECKYANVILGFRSLTWCLTRSLRDVGVTFFDEYYNNNTKNAALAKLPSTTHPLEWAEPHTL